MQQLRVALIGAGFMGRAHTSAYHVARLGRDLAAELVPGVVIDADGELARAFAEQFGWPESGTDWRSVLDREDIDVVDICTPPQFHAELARAAIAAGKHVFCEKPITNDIGEAVDLAATASAAGVIAQVGLNYRHTPAVGLARQLLTSGTLGRPTQVRVSYLQDTGFGAAADRWRASRSTGGSGTAGDIGSHAIDLAEFLCGDIVRVAALLRSRATDGSGWLPESQRLDGDLIDDAGVWIAEFAEGAIGSFSVSSFSSGSKNRLALSLDAEQGALAFDWNNRDVLDVSSTSDPPDRSGFRSIATNDQHPDGIWRVAGLGTGYLEVSAVQFQKFVRAITGDLTGAVDPLAVGPDFAAAAHVQQVVGAVADAAAGGGWVDVPARDAVPA